MANTSTFLLLTIVITCLLTYLEFKHQNQNEVDSKQHDLISKQNELISNLQNDMLKLKTEVTILNLNKYFYYKEYDI